MCADMYVDTYMHKFVGRLGDMRADLKRIDAHDCMCVHVYARMCAGMCAGMYADMCAGMCAGMYAGMCAGMCIGMHR